MKRWIAIAFAIAAIGGLIGWRAYGKAKDAQMQAQGRQAAAKAAPPVTVAPVTARDVVQTFVGVGTVVAPYNVKIAPKVSGRLDYLVLREGAPVHIGDVVARIDPSQIQAQVSQQQAAVAEAESRLAQAQFTQNPTNVNVATQIQQQVAALASARADDSQVRQNYQSQVAAAQSAVTDAQGRIDNATAAMGSAEASIRSAQANLTNAQVRYNRTYDLYKQGFIAAQDVDDAKTTVNVQQEAVSVSRGQLNSAQAARNSAVAQKASAQEEANIVAVKGKADIAAADAKVAQARAALKYAQSNTAQGPAYRENLAALRSNVNAAKAQLRNVQSQLSDTILKSPINGFVTARYVDPGAIVSPSQPVIAVQAIRDVFVDTSVPEDIGTRLHVGQPADVVFDALPGRSYRANVIQITPAADPQSRQFPVRVTLPNSGNTIKPGMFARVTLVTQRIPGAIVVPREAVRRGKDGASVVVVNADGTAHTRPVETGAEDANGIQIREGVRPKELVVTLSSAPIKDGQKVKIVTSSGAGAGGTMSRTGGRARTAERGAGDAAGGASPTSGGAGITSGGVGATSPVSGGQSSAPQTAGTATTAPQTPPAGAAPSTAGQSSGALSGSAAAGATPASNSNPTNRVPNNPPQVSTPTPTSVPGAQSSGAAAGGARSGASSTTAPSGASPSGAAR